MSVFKPTFFPTKFFIDQLFFRLAFFCTFQGGRNLIYFPPFSVKNEWPQFSALFFGKRGRKLIFCLGGGRRAEGGFTWGQYLNIFFMENFTNFYQIIFFFIIFIRMICSLCTISKHLALKNTKHDALKLIHWEAWCCSLAGSAYQVWEAFTSPSSVVEPTVACLTGTNVPCLGRANRTGNLGVWTHFRNHKSADLPLLQGAEFTARCHVLPGSRRGSRRSTIQLAEGGHLFLPPNSDHLAPLQGWGGWRVMIEHSWGFSRSFSFFSRNFMARLLCSRSKFFSQKLFSPSCISSHGWGRWFLLLLGWGRQGSLPPGFHGEGEVVPNCQREGEGRTLASQHLAKVQALGCKWHIFRCCSHFHSLFLS